MKNDSSELKSLLTKAWWNLWVVVLKISTNNIMCILTSQFERLSETLHFLMMNLLKVTVLMKDFDNVLSAAAFYYKFFVTVKWLSFFAKKLSLF